MGSLEYAARLMASAFMTDRRKKGCREDSKLCDAKPGECRLNNKYYSPGMRDEKSWSMPYADDGCPISCPFLVK